MRSIFLNKARATEERAWMDKTSGFVQRLYQSLEGGNMMEFFSLLGQIKRKADYWIVGEIFFKTYGFNFKDKIWRQGTGNDIEQLSQVELKMYSY